MAAEFLFWGEENVLKLVYNSVNEFDGMCIIFQ